MYTKVDLEQNAIMNKIIKENQIKMRNRFEKEEKQYKLFKALLIGSSMLFFVGVIYLLMVIETMRF